MDGFSDLDLGEDRIVKTSPSLQQKIHRYTPEVIPPHTLEVTPLKGEKPGTTLKRALSVVKLFKDEIPLADTIFYNNKTYRLNYFIPWGQQGEYHLSESERSDFCQFWNDYRKIDSANFAVRRFNLANFRPSLDDRFADYVASMEYLFAPDSKDGGISFKFRVIGTMVLGNKKSENERREIYDKLKEAYNLRSAIVHGNQKTVKKLLPKNNKSLEDKWEELIKPIRHYNRQAIQRFFLGECLENSKDRGSFIESMIIRSKLD